MAVTSSRPRSWVLLYVERWLRDSMQQPDGSMTERHQGTPQGGVVAHPTIANNGGFLDRLIVRERLKVAYGERWKSP